MLHIRTKHTDMNENNQESTVCSWNWHCREGRGACREEQNNVIKEEKEETFKETVLRSPGCHSPELKVNGSIETSLQASRALERLPAMAVVNRGSLRTLSRIMYEGVLCFTSTTPIHLVFMSHVVSLHPSRR